MSISLPPFPEQERIVKYLDEETGKVDLAIEVKRQKIALLCESREDYDQRDDDGQEGLARPEGRESAHLPSLSPVRRRGRAAHGRGDTRRRVAVPGPASAGSRKRNSLTRLEYKLISFATQTIDTSVDAAQWGRAKMRFVDDCEHFFELPLVAAYKPLSRAICATSGLLNETPAGAREVVRSGSPVASGAIIVAHNHPSGDPPPSGKDVALSKELLASSKVLHITFLDHLVVGLRGSLPGFISLRQTRKLKFEGRDVEKYRIHLSAWL